MNIKNIGVKDLREDKKIFETRKNQGRAMIICSTGFYST